MEHMDIKLRKMFVMPLMFESTLYPVLRRLLKDNCLETYDQEYQGRNRRYYKITPQGQAQLQMYRQEWTIYVQKINRIIEEGK